MKKLFIIFSSVIAAGLIIFAFTMNEITEITIGAPLPKGDLKMKDISGREITLKDSKKENGLLVVFSCNTCPFVVKSEIAIKEIGKQASDSKVGYVLVNSNEAQRGMEDSFEEMKKYAVKQAYDFSYVEDINSEVADAFGATRTPQSFLFDKNLKLVYKGAFTDDTDPQKATKLYLRDAVTAVREGKEVLVSSTKSIGCTIKRKQLQQN